MIVPFSPSYKDCISEKKRYGVYLDQDQMLEHEKYLFVFDFHLNKFVYENNYILEYYH